MKKEDINNLLYDITELVKNEKNKELTNILMKILVVMELLNNKIK